MSLLYGFVCIKIRLWVIAVVLCFSAYLRVILCWHSSCTHFYLFCHPLWASYWQIQLGWSNDDLCNLNKQMFSHAQCVLKNFSVCFEQSIDVVTLSSIHLITPKPIKWIILAKIPPPLLSFPQETIHNQVKHMSELSTPTPYPCLTLPTSESEWKTAGDI